MLLVGKKDQRLFYKLPHIKHLYVCVCVRVCSRFSRRTGKIKDGPWPNTYCIEHMETCSKYCHNMGSGE